METDQQYPEPDIVLADDDHEDCLIFSEALKQLLSGAKLTTVKNGDLLIKLLLTHLPDLLFLDIHMPCKDGKQCIKEIRANSAFDKLPIIIYSGMSQPEMISFFFREGANRFMIKPYSMNELIRNLQSILGDFFPNFKNMKL